MDKEREDILNDLIKYYDGDTKPAPPKADELENTRAVPVPKSSNFKPAPDDLGQTLVVKTAAPPAEDKPAAEQTRRIDISDIPPAEKPAADSTRRIDISDIPPAEKPAADSTRRIDISDIQTAEKPPVQTAQQPVTEEVFGFLDLSGKPIDPSTRQEEHTEPAPAPAPQLRSRQHAEFNQTEMNDKKRSGIWYSLKPLWVTLIACLIVFGAFEFYRIDTGIIGTFKLNFNDNMHVIFNKLGWKWEDIDVMPEISGIQTSKRSGENKLLAGGDVSYTQVNSYTERDNVREEVRSPYNYIGGNRTVIPFAGADDSDFLSANNGIICAKSNYVCFIGADGKKSWETSTTISDPIISACGKYIVLASKGGRQLCLYKKHKLQYTVNVPYNIRECKVSSKGDVVLAADRAAYKGAVLMINPKGETVFSWSSGVNYITGINVLANRRIAVSLANADSRLTSYLMLFNIKSTEPESGAEFADTLLYEVYIDEKTILVNGDNCIAKLDNSGNIKYDMRYDNAVITHSANDYVKGNRVLTYINKNHPFLTAYDKNGDVIKSYQIENTPDFLDLYGTTILYNNGRTLISGNIYEDKRDAYRAPRAIKRLMLLNYAAYAVVYDDCIEIVRVN